MSQIHRSARGNLIAGAVCLLALLTAPAAHPATEVTGAIPAGVAPDNATVFAVLCTIKGGYPNNIYAIKGTFSADERRPFYGVNWAAFRQLWASQEERWDSCQPKVTTDQYGNYAGYIFMRLEQTAPIGHLEFRVSTVALSPIADPGPSVSPWYETVALTMAPGGNGAWIKGHIYTNPECTVPANGVVVRAISLDSGVAGACLAQYSALPDGGDPTDVGSFKVAVPSGWVARVEARTRNNEPVDAYVKISGPYNNAPGETESVDACPFGDVNGDGVVNAHDVYLAMRTAAGIHPGPNVYAARADIWPDPPDGAVTLEDAVCIARVAYLK